MKYKHILLLAISLPVLAPLLADAQGTPPATPPLTESTTAASPPRIGIPQNPMRPQTGKLHSFEFVGADLDTVMTMYCEWTGKTYLKNDTVNASISLKADRLTTSDCIDVLETILAMNDIALVPYGDKFIKVVKIGEAIGEGLPPVLDSKSELGKNHQFATQLIQLKNVTIREVQTAIQHLMDPQGKIQTLESSNSLLVTDTKANILRIRELVEFIDKASARIEPRFYEIKYAEAAELAGKLNEIITMAQSNQQTTSRTSTRTTRTTPGAIRARGTSQAATTPTRAAISSTQAGEQMIIQGNVKVMADERTNLILIFSQKENYDFFDKIIKTLDVEVEPAITFEVVNLEYADAEELSGTLNDLVGAAQGNRSTTSGSSSSRTSGSRTSTSRTSSSRTSNSRTSPGAMVTPNAAPSQAASIENLSQLSENTKILADARSNSILLMGRKSDIAAIKIVITSLDIMLEQVVIEAVIFDVGLGDRLEHGLDWLYTNADESKIGGWDGQSLTSATNNLVQTVASSALSYYQVFPNLDSKALIRLLDTDTDSRLISTPVIMTTDNTEATLSIGEKRPVVTSTDTYASSLGGQRSNYEYKDIGIQLTVTPRINPQRFVVMELTQRADQLGEIVTIDDNQVPTIKNREFEASIAVPDGGSVVLGGLVSTEIKDSISKIPILGDIPLIGRYLFSSVTKTEDQRELIVLMTPYVMANMAELTGQTERLYRETDLRKEDWEGSWSQSKLRHIPDSEE